MLAEVASHGPHASKFAQMAQDCCQCTREDRAGDSRAQNGDANAQEDLQRIDSGLVPLPDFWATSECLYLPESQPRERLGPGSGQQKASAPVPKKTRVDTAGTDRRKGVPWTEEEHRLFLIGLSQFGKGDWRSIARNYVVSRTPTQVASHAQKYFIRLNSANKKDKRRASIHDITSSTVI
ncbi:hypothetical protein QJQ45_009529 [Haematococcus lacustris]|nr:hypothetical protein QJQ45_009529 [Haematococcus lacustris]